MLLTNLMLVSFTLLRSQFDLSECISAVKHFLHLHVSSPLMQIVLIKSYKFHVNMSELGWCDYMGELG